MLLDPATLQKSADMDPAIAEFLRSNPAPKVDWADAESAYNTFAMISKNMAEQIGAAEATIVEEYHDVPMRDGFLSSIKVHRPATPPPGGSPLIAFFFGGGWVGGDREAGSASARAYVRLFGATVVSVSYRLAPQHKFPAAQHDCWDTVKWLDEHAEARLGASPTRAFVLSGISAGASNAACAVAHALGADNGVDGQGSLLRHPITGLHLCVPWLMDERSVPAEHRARFISREQNRDAPILPASALRDLERHTEWDARSPWRYVVNSKAALSEFPPTTLQVCGMDTLRDDGLIFEEMLKEAGVKTRLDFYPGCPHAHFAFYPGIAPSLKALADMVAEMGWLLGSEVSPQQALSSFMRSS